VRVRNGERIVQPGPRTSEPEYVAGFDVLDYDNRDDRLGDAARTPDVWFGHSADGGSSWSQTHVAGPFDFRTAPRPSGDLRLGEYQGLAGLRKRGFAAVFTQAAPQAKDGPTDIFFARIGPRR
jgi:hypothetical protein